MRAFLRAYTGDEVVEYVEVAFTAWDAGYAAALEVVVEDFNAAYAAFACELEFCVFGVAGGVGVEEGACVAEGFEDELGGGDGGGEFGVFLAWWWGGEGEEGFGGEAPGF